MNKKISHLIVETCKQQGIKYKSINPNYVSFCEDAAKLGEYCQTILALIDKIDIILNKHNIRIEFKNKIIEEINNLHNLEHDLCNLAQKIIAEEKNG